MNTSELRKTSYRDLLEQVNGVRDKYKGFNSFNIQEESKEDEDAFSQ